MDRYKLIFKRFGALRETWTSMETPDMSPFLHYDYMKYIRESVALFKPYFTRIACICPVASEDILMILPLKLRMDFRSYSLLGDMQGCDIADVLWKPEISETEKREILRFFFRSFKAKVYLNRIPEQSLLRETVPPERVSFSRDVEYVAVDIPEEYDTWYGTLVYSVRRNNKTHYNRMEKAGIRPRLIIYDGQNPMKDAVWDQIIALYIQRLVTKYGQGLKGFFGRAVTRIKYRYLKHDSRSLRSLSNSFHAVLMDGDSIMAFLSGLKTHDGKTIAVPRLAMDARYYKYSPGYALMNETIRYLSGQNEVKVLDMSRGDEQYKKDFGGRSYFIKDYVIEKA